MSDKPGAPQCGLYYRINKAEEDNTLNVRDCLRNIRQINMVINRTSGYERNMHVIELNAALFSPDDTQMLIQTIQNEGGVALLSGDIKDPENITADGVILNDLEQLQQMRTALGEKAILGLHCGTSKELAQGALDHGVDFVAFGIHNYGIPDIKLLAWWTSVTNKPALALGNITNDSCGLLARSGAGFVDVTTYIDSHEDGIMQAAVNVLYTLSLADKNLI